MSSKVHESIENIPKTEKKGRFVGEFAMKWKYKSRPAYYK